MSPWQLWLLVALLLLLADLFVAGGASGVLLVLAIAALGGMLAALFGLDFGAQLLVSAVTGLAAIPLVIVWLRRVTRGAAASTVSDPRIKDRPFEVIRRGERLGVRMLGDFFPIREINGRELAAGDEVWVEHFEGIVAVVRRARKAADVDAGVSS